MYRFKVLAAAREARSYQARLDNPMAMDTSGSQQARLANTTATVIVLVLDENDNAPVFSSQAYFFTVQEGPSPQVRREGTVLKLKCYFSLT